MLFQDKIVKHGKLTWMDVRDPDQAFLEKIKDEFGFHHLDIEDCLSDHQRSKIDEYDDYLFIILHVPYFDKKRQRVLPDEIDVFIKNDLLITVHWGNSKALSEFFEDVKENPAQRKKFMGQEAGYLLYEVIDHLFSGLFPMLEKMEKNLTNLEREVFQANQQRDMLRDILEIKKNIITFRRYIAPQRAVIAQIEHKNKKFLPSTLEIYFDDTVDKIEKIWSTLENLKELVESLQDTNESIISHTTNKVIKTLTVFSVVMLPLTFLTGLYGMNVNLPLAEHPQVFLFLVALMTIVILGMLGFFKYKRWI